MIAIDDFEALRVPAAAFHHAEHVELAWRYLEASPLPEALARFRAALVRFAASIGKANLYDEAITAWWIRLIASRRRAGEGWDAFAAKNPDLFDKGLVKRGADSLRGAAPLRSQARSAQ
jgi:hypothetical protein